MGVWGRSMMAGVVVGGLMLASYGIAREQYPELDDHAAEALDQAQDLAGNTVDGLVSLMWRTSQQRARTEGAETDTIEFTEADSVVEVLEDDDALTQKTAEEVAELVVEMPVGPRPGGDYDAVRYDLELLRTSLAAQQARGQDAVPAAQAVLELYLPKLMEAWVGTPYHYSGTTEVPGEGSVACGYYVSTVLEHAGFVVDRVELARQPSEQIARSLVRDPEIQRFSNAKRRTVVDAVRDLGDGIYIVGLDTHAGFLFERDGEVTFCHATRRGKLGVVCEDAESSPSMKSKYTVIGKIDDPHIVQAWLTATPLTTAQKGVAQEWRLPEPEPASPEISTEAG